MLKFSYANTRDKDIFYLLKTNILDNFFLLETDDKSYVFLNSLEIGAFKEINKNPKIEAVSSGSFFEKALRMNDKANVVGNAALLILQDYHLEEAEIEVSARFPLLLADFLRGRGIKLTVKNPYRPERQLKSREERNLIEEAIKKTHSAFQKIEEILGQSKIKDELLIYQEKTLTSDFLKREVEKIFLDQDLSSTEGIIISCGHQTALPHHQGDGPIKSNQSIICDLFPVSKINGYFADMTRTYVKGEPSDKLLKMYDAVKKAQETALNLIKPGIKAADLHQAVCQVFLENGFDVGEKGFIHSTGHGLGLDVHENPSISKTSETTFIPGHVITIEPGLYYPDIGGVRLEDIVYVTENGSENLTNYPKQFVIP